MRFHSTGFRAAALAMAGLIAGCSDGSDDTRTVFFSTSNYQGCATEYVRFHASENGELARNDDGTFDCTLSPQLAGAGCTLVLSENDNDDAIEAVVDGCRVPDNSSIFSCEYRDPDFLALNTDEGASCSCLAYEHSCYINGVCDMCASRDAERGACEDCDNRLDDDGDGRTDCTDRDCEFTQECGFGRTTLPCASTTTTITIPDQASTSELSGAN